MRGAQAKQAARSIGGRWETGNKQGFRVRYGTNSEEYLAEYLDTVPVPCLLLCPQWCGRGPSSARGEPEESHR